MTYHKTLSVLSVLTCFVIGCGAPPPTTKTPSTASTPPSASADTPNPNEGSKGVGSAPSNPANNNTPEEPIQAEVMSFDEQIEGIKPAQEIASVIPATNKETTAMLNLLDLPRFGEGNAMQSSSTYVYYSTKGNLTAADDFYKAQLSTLGWKEIPSSVPATEHYIDRLYSKDSFYLRASLSLGGQTDELGVMLASLGNIDVRELPKLSDAETTFAATPVNATYQTQKSITDATEEIQKILSAQGWQPWKDFQENPVSVPHYRDLHYRKEACRLLVGIVKNPQNPADKTSVSYISEFVTPFDTPMLSDGQTLKLDLYSNRASFESSSDRSDLIKLLQTHSENYGWTLHNADKFESGDEHMLPIHTTAGAYLVARLVESSGKYSVSLEAFPNAPKPKSPSTESVAAIDSPDKNTEATMKSNAAPQTIEKDVDSAIQAEVAKAIGSLSTPSGTSSVNLKELEAKARELQSMFTTDEQNENKTEDNPSQQNPFDVAEDTDQPPVEHKSIKQPICKVTFGDKTIELKYAACYVMYEYGEATKCILFSDQPIDQEKLQQKLLKTGESVYGIDVSPNAVNMFDFRVKKDSVSLNAKIDSFSLGMSTSKMKSNVLYHQGSLIGTLETIESLAVGDKELTCKAQINQPTVRVDWASRAK